MKFPRNIEIEGYDGVTVDHAIFTVSINIDDDETEVSLDMYASESKALRKALKAAEKLVALPSGGFV